MQLTDNTILITGGGSGIGRALAEAFLKLGNTVIVAGRDTAKLRETTAANPGIHSFVLDVGDADDVARGARELVSRHPTLNVLVNNAGIVRQEDLTQPDCSDAEAMIATNLLGPIRLTAALMPHFLDQPRAAVVNVTSGLAFVPLAATPTYCATKAALHSYTLSLREQLRDTNVDAIEIAPPYVQTHLSGAHQATDPRAMPLDEYIRDTMRILVEEPEVREVIIERVAPLRHAEARGSFEVVFAQLAEIGREQAANERR